MIANAATADRRKRFILFKLPVLSSIAGSKGTSGRSKKNLTTVARDPAIHG
jgi:hypothetical protein